MAARARDGEETPDRTPAAVGGLPQMDAATYHHNACCFTSPTAAVIVANVSGRPRCARSCLWPRPLACSRRS